MTPWFDKFRPTVWQGWLVYAFFLAALIYDYILIDKNSHSVGETLVGVFPQAAVLFLILAFIIRARRK
jgi:hypothetical protein